MIKQIGCESKNARFVPCSECWYNDDVQGCYEVREEANLKVVIR